MSSSSALPSSSSFAIPPVFNAGPSGGGKIAAKGRNKRDGKEQLDLTLTRLLNRLPANEDAIDASYLLDLDKRRRGGVGRKKRWTASSAFFLE